MRLNQPSHAATSAPPKIQSRSPTGLPARLVQPDTLAALGRLNWNKLNNIEVCGTGGLGRLFTVLRGAHATARASSIAAESRSRCSGAARRPGDQQPGMVGGCAHGISAGDFRTTGPMNSEIVAALDYLRHHRVSRVPGRGGAHTEYKTLAERRLHFPATRSSATPSTTRWLQVR
jgi:hypothetical protein